MFKLQLIRMQATLQFIVLQHGVDTLALFLHLLLWPLPVEKLSAGTPRLTGEAWPIIGSVVKAGDSDAFDDAAGWL